jgi:hypothetical protein
MKSNVTKQQNITWVNTRVLLITILGVALFIYFSMVKLYNSLTYCYIFHMPILVAAPTL